MKPLFIPLKSEYYEAFKDGSKTTEFRLYGPRWNEMVCPIGREVILSKGYGKHNRMKGIISGLSKCHGSNFGHHDQRAIMAVYGSLDVWIACISITKLKEVTAYG